MNKNGSLLCTLVFIVFLVLKLLNIGIVAEWSWWWITSPLWIGAAVSIGLYIVGAIFVFLVAVITAWFNRK